MAVTLGIISLVEKYVLPLINRGIAAIVEVFGVSEEDAKDIMSNEILIFAESVGVGALTLRTKIPTKIAERLGFTAKGFNKRMLVGKADVIKKGSSVGAIIAPGGTITLNTIEASAVVLKSKSVLSGFATAFDLVLKTLGVTFVGFIAVNNFIDFGNWNSGAYQKTFQKILALVTGGLLVPDEDYRKTKTVSPEVFDKVFNTYKIGGVVGINDPYKKQTVLFTRDNMIDLLDVVGADLLRTTQRASTKDVLLASQLFMIFKESKEAPAAAAAVAKAATLPKIKVFTGVLTQGKLGETDPFITRETDLIDSAQELQDAALNNLAAFLVALPGRIIYEIKIVASIITADGFIQRGTAQRVVTGFTTAGAARYKTVINKFAIVSVFVFTQRNVRTKIQTIVLGPVDSVAFQPKASDLTIAEQTIKSNLTTSNVEEIKTITTDQLVDAKQRTEIEEIITERGTQLLRLLKDNPAGFFADVDKLFEAFPITRLERDFRAAASTLAQKREIFKTENINPESVPEYQTRKNKLLNFPDPAVTTFRGFAGETMFLQPKEPILKEYQFAGPSATLPDVAIPASNNLNRCFSLTVAEFFDTNRQTYPSVAERSKLYEAFDLGPANWYTGTAEQNFKLLAELKKRSGC